MKLFQKALIVFCFSAALTTFAYAGFPPPVLQIGPVTPGDIATWNGNNAIKDGGVSFVSASSSWQDLINWNLIVGGTAFKSISQAGGGFNGQLDTAIGQNALFNITTGYNNTAIGGGAVGVAALSNTTTGHSNIAIGAGALATNTTGSENVVVGSSLEFCSVCTSDVIVGNDDMIDSGSTSGNFVTGVGEGALFHNNANFNTAVGYNALEANTTGSPNEAFGYFSLEDNTTGVNNVAVGEATLQLNTSGTNNTAIGHDSLNANLIGVGNTALGSFSLSTATGGGNTALGYGELYTVVGGINNTAVGGGSAAAGVTSGNNNSIFGFGVNTTLLTTGNNNILIGTDASTSALSSTVNNSLNIGNIIFASNLQNSTNITGSAQVGIGTNAPPAGIALRVIGSTQLDGLTVNGISNSGGYTVGASGRRGTFVCSGAGTISIANATFASLSDVVISMAAQGGTITTPPAFKSVAAGTGFLVLCGATDTSTYNYLILN